MRYRIHAELPGKPDILFPTARLAVFVDSCFWHDCPIHRERPDHNAQFWQEKLERNSHRDRQVDEALLTLGWKPFRVWEHDIESNLENVVESVVDLVRNALPVPRGQR
jgi:DNA mismatch endonuclease (patch repair protein)